MKYAPANEDGLKPWVVTISEWGRKRERIVYAEKASRAVFEAKGRRAHTSARARRATPDDIARLP